MIGQTEIQKFMALSLKNNAEFSTLCTSELGSELNFYIDSSVRETYEELPYFVIHKDISDIPNQDADSYVTQFVICASMPETTPTEDTDGIFVFPTIESVENVIMKAIEVIKCALRDLGINGDKEYYIGQTRIAFAEIGEADELLGAVEILLQKDKFLNS